MNLQFISSIMMKEFFLIKVSFDMGMLDTSLDI